MSKFKCQISFLFFCSLVLLFAFVPPVRGQLLIEAVPTPNDPFYFENQTSYFEQIHLWDAWAKTTGTAEVIIAVIDSGVDTDHPDIIGNMWFNRGEIPLNGLDDDKNGFVDDLNGWDFLENTSDAHPKFNGSYTFAGSNHGTVVAGIAAASTNNSEGLAGVCWQCKIMALRAVSGDGTGTTEDVAKAIQYAIDNGADIINMSFVGAQTDEILNQAIARAYQAGIVLVAAVGNDAEEDFFIGGDLDFRPLYPVCADGGPGANHIVGVGSVDRDNRRSSFSNFGFRCIDINVPGNGIAGPQLFDPVRGGRYNNKYRAGWRGTSMSTPIVSGVAGLMKSVNPRLSNDQIAAIIRETGRNIDGENLLYIGQLGAGLLDAAAAVNLAAETPGLAAVNSGRLSVNAAKRTIWVLPRSGRKVEILAMDLGGAETARYEAYPAIFKGGGVVASGDVDGDGSREVIVGAGPGGGPQVRVFTTAGKVVGQWFAYDRAFRGGMSVAAGDEVITAAIVGRQLMVRVFNLKGEPMLGWVLKPSLIGAGVPSVAVGDVDNDGEAEIVLGLGRGALPEVQIFDRLGKPESSFLAYTRQMRGGVNVAVGDADGDGQMEIITAPVLGGPHIKIFNAKGKVLGQFFAFEKEFRGGASVAVGNVDGDKGAEIVVGAGSGRAAEVRVFSQFGSDFVQDSVFTVFEPGFRGGVNVGI